MCSLLFWLSRCRGGGAVFCSFFFFLLVFLPRGDGVICVTRCLIFKSSNNKAAFALILAVFFFLLFFFYYLAFFFLSSFSHKHNGEEKVVFLQVDRSIHDDGDKLVRLPAPATFVHSIWCCLVVSFFFFFLFVCVCVCVFVCFWHTWRCDTLTRFLRVEKKEMSEDVRLSTW